MIDEVSRKRRKTKLVLVSRKQRVGWGVFVAQEVVLSHWDQQLFDWRFVNFETMQ
jgi:hypothetical protein